MREEDGRTWRSPIRILLVVLSVLFLAECFATTFGGTPLRVALGLNLSRIQAHQYWRLITFQFLHDAPWPFHLLFNALGLWFFGRSVLEALGPRRFWKIYLLAGLAGGLFEVAAQWGHAALTHNLVRGMTVGASANVLGLAGAFCLLFPTRENVFLIYFFPVRMRSMTMFWVLFAFSAFGTVFPYGGVAHAAHLGGLLAGAAFIRLWVDEDARAWLRRLAPRRPRPRTKAEVPVAAGAGPSKIEKAAQPPLSAGESDEDFIRREIDPILDKISAHGLQSLTDRERRLLESARERMRGR